MSDGKALLIRDGNSSIDFNAAQVFNTKSPFAKAFSINGKGTTETPFP